MKVAETIEPGQQTASEFDRALKAERARRVLRDRILVITTFFLALASVLSAWQIIHVSGLIPPIFVSDPLSVSRALWVLLTTAATWNDIWASFSAALAGLLIGSVLGIGSGIVFARVPILRRAVNPFLTLFNALPRPALAPVFILWFGLGALPKIAVAVSIVYFVLLMNTMAGIKSTDPDLEFLGRSLSMSKWQRFYMIELPHATPAIVAGLRLGAVYSVLGVVVAEIVAANAGTGQLLVGFTNQFAIAESFAVLAIMALMATVLDIAVRLIQWRLTWSDDA